MIAVGVARYVQFPFYRVNISYVVNAFVTARLERNFITMYPVNVTVRNSRYISMLICSFIFCYPFDSTALLLPTIA